MPMSAVTVLMGRVIDFEIISQASITTAPVIIEAGIRTRWSAEAKIIRAR